MSITAAVGSGLAGACALTLLHETVRRTVPAAPRMDILGERAIVKAADELGVPPPPREALHPAALAGDIVSNTVYYSAVGLGDADGAVERGAVLGLAAGLGAVLLPGPLGLGTAPSSRTTATAVMTVGLYLAGGLAAGLAYQLLNGQE